MNSLTATNASPVLFVRCEHCDLLLRVHRKLSGGEATVQVQCPRCGAAVHRRKPHSLSRTWALLLAAIILYFPANWFPVMKTTGLGRVQEDTILSGVMYLLKTGMWPLAALVFFASIVVPLTKLCLLMFLLMSVHLRSTWRPRERTRLYRITETVGRWSMVDIYVVTILVALVQVGAVANIEAGIGALFFGIVVVLTMLAARTFDPRLIWDTMDTRHERA